MNKVILIGRLGKDPESKYTQSGVCMTQAPIATTERWTGSDGQRNEKTTWHRVVFWGKTAEIAKQYLRKGSRVFIEGRLQTRKWQDQNGNDRHTTEVVVQQMEMLDGKAQSQASASASAPEPDFGPEPASAPPQQTPPPQQQRQPQQTPQAPAPVPEYDDIPF